MSLNDNDDFERRPHPPIRLQLVGPDGKPFGSYRPLEIAKAATERWGDAEQDAGFDIQVAGAK